MSDTRLIEHWLPITEIGIESLRERTPMTPFPAPNRMHVWWARRPLVASRAAILSSLLPASADQAQFMHILGIHGDPIASKRRIERARKTKENLGPSPWGYDRSFKYLPSEADRDWLKTQFESLGLHHVPAVLDPTAGGGSIPFESSRLGLCTFGNDLNPVAVLLEKATVDFPARFGLQLFEEYSRLADRFLQIIEPRFIGIFPREEENAQVLSYLWARSIVCPYCAGVVPLSPNWRLAPDGTGIRLRPQLGAGPNDTSRVVKFEIVNNLSEQSAGTISDGDGVCPYSDCNRQIDGDEIKRQAQAGKMGEQLYAIVFKRRVIKTTKTGRTKEGWEHGYRSPQTGDEVSSLIQTHLDEKMPIWEALGFVPNEPLPPGQKTEEPRRYGMTEWKDLFSPRQLFGHCTAVEVFNELLEDVIRESKNTELTKAALVYLAISLDKLRDYNSRMSRWHVNREVMVNTFDRHDFAFKWSYAEMAPAIVGLGYAWATEQTGKCIKELAELARPDIGKSAQQSSLDFHAFKPSQLTLTCKSGDSLDHISDHSVDCVVMDPPYYDNVMYAELSDFFYVWLKRTAGRIHPELFRRQLTDKDSEAVANPSKFKGEKGAKALAGREYQDRMSTIFSECRRVLKSNGIMTLMFTHKATGAWDALTKGLMEAGFMITASWPINTEAEGSLHIKDKAAANSTIFLVCRPRDINTASDNDLYWEDVEPLVAQAVRRNVKRFKEAGIGGVDLYLASFGPALEEFSKHWPLKRGTPRPRPDELKRKRQSALFEEEFDPYSVTPEDALDAARREVKNWKLEQLTHMKSNAELDAATSWFVLAWDAFRATVFDYDEALRLARAVGVDLDKDIIGWLAEKKGSDVRLWDSATRAAKGSLGPADGSRAIIDAIHHAAHVGRTRNLSAAHELLTKNYVDQDPKFFASLEAVLEVLPVSKAFSGIELEGEVAGQGSDFEILENLRRLAYSDKVDEPKQLDLWKDESATT